MNHNEAKLLSDNVGTMMLVLTLCLVLVFLSLIGVGSQAERVEALEQKVELLIEENHRLEEEANRWAEELYRLDAERKALSDPLPTH